MEPVTESIAKNRQSPDVLRAMVARAFGDDRVPEGDGWADELGHGWFNVAYRVRLRDGASVALKIAPPAGVEVMTYERNAMRTEVAALALIRERTEVPVPAVLFHDDTHELCDADYFFMEYVDADNLGVVKDDLPRERYLACEEALGAANRALNGIPGDRFGPLLGGPPSGTSWREVFTGLLENVLRDGERRGVDLGQDYDAIRRIVARHADSLDEVTEPVFIEWDLWDFNVMVRDGALVSIIDHERALYGDPLFEARFLPVTEPELSDGTLSFLRGYGREPSFTEAELTRRRLYTLYLFLIMVIETVFRGHEDPSQYHSARERLAASVAELSGAPSVEPAR
ncbi:phosphotransferase family protein [Streptomyces sp. PT12]|uniref:phosphotransferase family protein n=1 Tax=Streptomyces sp. PT12 TaxID=1510197 RepID=UPI000DE57A67|nr:aminoglycoside phosphotransferase family protein [Streptomyces sp. PT12]RBM18699.1 aminoglycoside phosphotransferase [Streptomyces sp. PT12]